MGALDGRVAIITGAGRGLGREHALLFASEGAKVVVNDLGGDMHGERRRPELRRSRPSTRSRRWAARRSSTATTSPTGTARSAWCRQAVDTFGDLHVLVNNAGILRDRVIVNMTEDEWDAVIARAPQGPLLPDPARRRLLARADQGRQGR